MALDIAILCGKLNKMARLVLFNFVGIPIKVIASYHLIIVEFVTRKYVFSLCYFFELLHCFDYFVAPFVSNRPDTDNVYITKVPLGWDFLFTISSILLNVLNLVRLGECTEQWEGNLRSSPTYKDSFKLFLLLFFYVRTFNQFKSCLNLST